MNTNNGHQDDHKHCKPDSPKDEARRRERNRKRVRTRLRKIYRRLFKNGEDLPKNYTPWLVIRYRNNDLGLRPIPNGDPHWKSPDIYIESSDPNGNAVSNQENFIHARVFNFGFANAFPVKVDFYYANPSLGLSEEHMNFIGSEYVHVQSQNFVDVRCNTPFIPDDTDLGHRCIKVNCSNHILDPITNPFNPKLDRHVGQRNITVIEGTAAAFLNFDLIASNLFTTPAEATLTFNMARLTASEFALEKLSPIQIVNHVVAFNSPLTNTPNEILNRFHADTSEYQTAQKVAKRVSAMGDGNISAPEIIRPAGNRLRTSALRFKAEFSESLGQVFPAKLGANHSNILLAQDKFTNGGSCRKGQHIPIEQILMKPFEQRKIHTEFVIPADAQKGEFITLDIDLGFNGIVTGGYTIVLKVN